MHIYEFFNVFGEDTPAGLGELAVGEVAEPVNN